MTPARSFTADDPSSSIVTGAASCLCACSASTTIGRQLGSSATARATYVPENGSEHLLGVDQQQQQQQQNDSSIESVF